MGKINIDEKFKNPYEVANNFVDVIAPTFGLTKGVSLAIKARLKLTNEEELKKCMLDALKFLATEFKK